jgi:hypothetical protein
VMSLTPTTAPTSRLIVVALATRVSFVIFCMVGISSL